MGRIIKWLFYLAVLGFLALVAYAYVGPLVDSEFEPEPKEIRIPVELDAG